MWRRLKLERESLQTLMMSFTFLILEPLNLDKLLPRVPADLPHKQLPLCQNQVQLLSQKVGQHLLSQLLHNNTGLRPKIQRAYSMIPQEHTSSREIQDQFKFQWFKTTSTTLPMPKFQFLLSNKSNFPCLLQLPHDSLPTNHSMDTKRPLLATNLS